MAKLKNSSESILSGKIGNVVYVQMEGKTYARGVPKRAKGAWSPKQQLHRQRFKKVNDFCHKFMVKDIRYIWNQAAETNRGYSLFVKTNMPVFALDGSMIDVQLLQLTAGKLHLPQLLKVSRVEGSDSAVAVTWKNDPNLVGERLKDQLMAISSNGRIYSKILATGIKRNAMGGVFELPELHFPATHLFLFFASGDGIDYSASCSFVLNEIINS